MILHCIKEVITIVVAWLCYLWENVVAILKRALSFYWVKRVLGTRLNHTIINASTLHSVKMMIYSAVFKYRQGEWLLSLHCIYCSSLHVDAGHYSTLHLLLLMLLFGFTAQVRSGPYCITLWEVGSTPHINYVEPCWEIAYINSLNNRFLSVSILYALSKTITI